MLTLSDAKSHLNVTFDADDSLIQAKLDAATAWVEAYTGAQVTENTAPPVNQAILMLTAHLYANREATLIGVSSEVLPYGFLALLDPYRSFYFG
ncbi:MAG: phage gp6-like head-tail connector protein [Rhizobiales bacterium]|nr:phage gp6-like head-tail connector protein [Hyphomicrobiales bacterium]MBN9015281.1 phage gp6-like head-tail connector protein [Hyphomicrobiales bacterium]